MRFFKHPTVLLAAFAGAAPHALAEPLAPTSALPAPETSGVSLAGDLDRGWAPPFRASERDQQAAALTIHWSPTEAASLRLHYEVLAAQWPDGTKSAGSGDITLGAAGRVWSGASLHPALPEVWVDWSAKLPNASDQSETDGSSSDPTSDPDAPREYGLGTDETDSSVGGALRWRLDPGVPITVMAGGSLLILGNPLMYANQDDAARFALLAEAELGAVAPFLRSVARMESPRNPADVSGALGAEWRAQRGAQGLRAGAEGRLGFTPAAADRGGSVWLGYAWGCPDCGDD